MPTSVTDEERARRVREEGSRRQRDLAGLRRVEAGEVAGRLAGVRSLGRVDLAAIDDRLSQAVPESTFRIWLAPLQPVGAEGATLYLSAPREIRSWVERRYSRLMREALKSIGYTDVEFVDMAQEER